MAQRQKGDDRVALLDVQVVGGVMQVVAEILVRQHHALGVAGCAGGVDDRCELLRLRLGEPGFEGCIARLEVRGIFQERAQVQVALGKLPSSKTTTRSSAGSSPAFTAFSYCSSVETNATLLPESRSM